MMNFFETTIAGLLLVETTPVADERGAFVRWFCDDELAPLLGGRRVRQINHSATRAVGTVRGMHFQRAPHAEMKLVRCIRGRVWDVAVDLREDSPTYRQWHSVELSRANARMLVIPEGFAHGFQALESDSELVYLHTARYEKSAEGGVAPTDSALAIEWPLPITTLSARDSAHRPLEVR